MLRKPISWLLFAGLCLLTAGRPGLAAPPTPHAWQSKVDPWVLEGANSGQTEFILFLPAQADLSHAAALPSKLEKGRYVYETLTEVAGRTQGPLIAMLKARGIEHRPYWVANMIWARGDLAAVQALARRADVAHIYANPTVKLVEPTQSAAARTLVAPAAPDAIEWNITKVNAPAVWAAGYKGQDTVIAGQDTGYQWDHPALKSHYRGWDGTAPDHDYNWHDAIHTTGSSCGADSPVPCDDHGHGTHTMGTMVGDDGGSNQIGMAPGAKWIGCRNMDRGNGTPASYAECYQWFIAPTKINGTGGDPAMAPDVINNSWGCLPSEGCTDDPNVLLTVVRNVRAAGIVTVHSAGNSGSACGTVNTPAAIYEESFSVGATTNTDTDSIWSDSSRGPVTVDGSNRLKPNVSAPGVNIRSSTRDGAYQGGWQGTSMAGPHVAGLVALLISAEPSIAGEVDYIEDIIEQSAVRRTTTEICGSDTSSSVPNNVYGWGRIDALAAYNLLRSPFTVTATPATADICTPNDASYTVAFVPKLGSFPGPVTPSISGVPASATAAFNPNPVAASWSTTLTIGNTASAAAGTYPLVITGTTGLASGSASAQLHLHSTPPAAVSEVAIDRTSAGQVQLTWSDAAGATGYQMWRAVNEPYFAAGFNCASPAPYDCETVRGTSYLHASLGDPAHNTTYLIRPVNACGTAAGETPRAGAFGYALTPGNLWELRSSLGKTCTPNLSSQ